MVKKETLAIVSNASPLISLIQLNKLEILKRMYLNILISEEVYKEISHKEQRECLQKEIRKAWIKKIKVPKLNVLHDLGIGEASSISLALQYDKSLLIIDDLEARSFAKSIGLEVIGTVGVLLFAKEKKIIDNLKNLLDKLQIKNLWLSNELYKKILNLAGE